MSIRSFIIISTLFTALPLTTGCHESNMVSGAVTQRGSGDSHPENVDAPTDPLNDKVDLGEVETTRYANCNGGALMIDRVRDHYVATVTDSGIVDYFIDQSEQVFQTTVEYSGESRVASVQKEFPWMVAVNEQGDGSKQLVISDLRLDDDASFMTSGHPGSTISHIDGGLKLVITGSGMTSSHSISYYEVGNWFFESCELEVSDSIPTSIGADNLVADCDEGAMRLERSAEREDAFIAIITDSDVAEYFLTQSEDSYCEEVSYSGESRTTCTQKRLNHSVTATEDGALLVDGLRAHGEHFSTSGRDGARLDREESGLRLTLRGSGMTSSHTISYYEVGQWLFETCTFSE